MKYIIQSKCFGDTKWNYRSEATDEIKAIINTVKAKKDDIKLKMGKDNSYRIIDKDEKVIFILRDDFIP